MSRFISVLRLVMVTVFVLVGPRETTAGSQTPFNIEAATWAYLDRPNAQEKAKSDAYSEGGYWLQLW